MASINVRKETGTLFITIHVNGQRYREQTKLKDNKTNRRKLEGVLAKIQTEIINGTFNYADFFPDSKNRLKFEQLRNASLQKASPVAKAVAESVSTAPTVAEYAQQWIAENTPLWRRNYIESIQSILNAHILPEFGEKKIDCVSQEEVIAFRGTLAKVNPKTGKVRSAKTINKTLKVMRMMFAEAADRLQFSSPLEKIKLLREKRKDINPFTLSEVQLILQHVRADFRIYFLVRFFTGMRSGEIDGLQWKFVDFERGEILVRVTWCNGQADETKNDGSQREIQMSSMVRDALLEQQKVTGGYAYVFCNSEGKPLDNRNVTNRVWYPLLRYLNLAKRRLYETRHTAATLWLAAGEAPEWIARQLGHVDTTMLFRVYSRYVPNLTRRDGSAMEQLLQVHGFAEVSHGK